MSVTKAANSITKHLPNASRYAVVKVRGINQPQISAELTVNMLPKSQVPKSGKVAASRVPWYGKYIEIIIRDGVKHNKARDLGMRMDDWVYDESDNKEVKEALKRIDDIELQLRAFRQVRASQLAFERMICPKEERFDLDNDVRYLHPWVAQVKRENAEADAWDSY